MYIYTPSLFLLFLSLTLISHSSFLHLSFPFCILPLFYSTLPFSCALSASTSYINQPVLLSVRSKLTPP